IMLLRLFGAGVRPESDFLACRVEVDDCYIGGSEAGLSGRLNLDKTLAVVAPGKPLGHRPNPSAPRLTTSETRLCWRCLKTLQCSAGPLPARQFGISTSNKSHLVVAKKTSPFPLFVWSPLRIHQMLTIMVDIRSCDSWWQRNGEAVYCNHEHASSRGSIVLAGSFHGTIDFGGDAAFRRDLMKVCLSWVNRQCGRRPRRHDQSRHRSGACIIVLSTSNVAMSVAGDRSDSNVGVFMLLPPSCTQATWSGVRPRLGHPQQNGRSSPNRAKRCRTPRELDHRSNSRSRSHECPPLPHRGTAPGPRVRPPRRDFGRSQRHTKPNCPCIRRSSQG